MMNRIGIFLFAIAVLAGCKGELEETRDVAYYQSNQAELDQKLEQCRNNPGELAETPNCKNAAAAKKLNFTGKSTTDYSDVFKSK